MSILIWLSKFFRLKLIGFGNSFYSYLPDRYSLNFSKYKKLTNFLDFSDLEKWNSDNYTNNIGDLSRFFFLNLCFDSLIEEGIVGDVAELGVYKGNSAFLLAKYARRVGKKCYLFDTFQGIDRRDLAGPDPGLEAEFSDTSLAKVKSLVGESNVTYVAGRFPDSLKQVNGINHFSLVHIDCDLERPFRAALDFFYPRLMEGGFLIMHDYSSLFWEGCAAAISEFFKDKPEYVVLIPDKSGTCAIRRMKQAEKPFLKTEG